MTEAGNGNPLAKPSPATEQRVQVHLRQARGKSVVFLARRYRRSLVGYLHALEAARLGPDSSASVAPNLEYGALDPRTITALKIVGLVAAEAARFARMAGNGGEAPDPQTLVGAAVDDALEALRAIADNDEPPGLRSRYEADERAPPYLIVLDALVGVSKHGKMD